MYLKRLEIMGFKSFAERTELEFVPGVTAVVGPNGSGKSNIADAMRWVLGEQSAKSLRGSKMEDIIFAGSDSRKALNFGEVAITLDNTDGKLPLDYSEITVTRRVYRSGESEYYINRQSCRLKDITELFMDTGLGKEAYSIIGQGRIEEVLSTKSEDRRGIFEEAAGIVKYKARKREAKKKLEETEANLLRIADIINEIKEQMVPLKEQADTAKVYKELKEELKNREIGLYVYNIEQLHHRWQESKQLVEKLKGEQINLSTEVSSRDAVIEQKRWRINQLDQELDHLQQSLLEQVQQLEKLEGQREVLKERERNAYENRTAFAEKMERLQQKRDQLKSELQDELVSRDKLQEETNTLQKKLQEEEKKWEGISLRLEGNLEQLKSDYIDLLGELAAARNERKNIEQQKQIHTQRMQRMQEEAEKQDHLLQGYSEQILEQEKVLLGIQAEIDITLAKYRDFQKDQQEIKEKEAAVSQLLRKKMQLRDQLSSRLELLKEMQADFTGFMQGVKEVLKVRESTLHGIHGAVAELISFPKEFETAIEIALGGALQHVIVDDEATGREAINFLKRNQLGRATFLPLTVMRSRRPSAYEEKQIQQERGIFGLASDLISFKETYRGVMENLLGSVVIAENLEIANRVARLTGYRYRVVTLDGDVVNPGGSMTGGTVKQKNTNLLGRGRAIEVMEQEWREVQTEVDQLQQEYNRLQQCSLTLHDQMEKLKEHGDHLRGKEQEANNMLTRSRTEYKNLEQRVILLQDEYSIYAKESQEVERQLQEILHRLQNLERAEAELKFSIELADKSKKEQENSREEMAATITNLKVTVAEVKQKLDSKVESIKRLKTEIAAIEQERDQQDYDLKSLFTLIEENEGLEKHLQGQIDNARTKKAELTDQIEQKKRLRALIHEEMSQLDQSTKDYRKKLRHVEEDLHREEVKENRYEVELDNLLQKLSEEYELTYESAKMTYPAPPDYVIDEVRKEVFRLKREITALGDVNLGSIEEYERLEERHRFLTSQSEDLTSAKISLYQVIEEMDQEMTKRFSESFDQIRYQFQRVFVKLFGGGRADLLLTDPEDLLETGIDIVAQPPGKKLQNLALLSGGERALTAIALLFAILTIRPVPFCVLDEVEAALDEANVSRFAQYLKEFSAQTQFIVITHRKGTMEEADVLYGVTMEGSGVSKLVSVKLKDLEQEEVIA